MASIAGLEAEATTVDLSNNSNTTTNVSTANGSSSNTTEKQPCSSKRIPVIGKKKGAVRDGMVRMASIFDLASSLFFCVCRSQ